MAAEVAVATPCFLARGRPGFLRVWSAIFTSTLHRIRFTAPRTLGRGALRRLWSDLLGRRVQTARLVRLARLGRLARQVHRVLLVQLARLAFKGLLVLQGRRARLARQVRLVLLGHKVRLDPQVRRALTVPTATLYCTAR